MDGGFIQCSSKLVGLCVVLVRVFVWVGWPTRAMRQRKLGSHTPPCHRRMVIPTLINVMLAALQRRPVLYHTWWLLTVHWLCSSEQ